MGKKESWWSGRRINKEQLIFYLILLFLPTQFGRHFWPSFAFVYGIRIDYLSPTLYITDILIFALFIFWIISKFKEKNFFKNVQDLKKLFLSHKLFLLFLFIAAAGIILSNNQFVGWYGFIKLLEFIFFGFYISVFINKTRLKTALALFSISVIFESVLSVAQFVNHGSLGGLFYFLGERTFNGQTPGIANASLNGELVLRPYATFSHPNVLAGFLLIGMLLLIYNIDLTTPRLKKILIYIALFFGTIALFLTMSRIAILLWLLIIIVLGIKKIKNNLKRKGLYFYLSIATLLILGIFFTPIGSRFINLNFSDEVFILRMELVKNSLGTIMNKPLFGTGINNYLVDLPPFWIAKYSILYLQPVHNIFLLIAGQIGLFGFLLFLIFLKKTFQNIIYDKQAKIYNLKFILLTVIIILGFFDHYFLTLQQGQLLFSFVLGICWSKKLNLS